MLYGPQTTIESPIDKTRLLDELYIMFPTWVSPFITDPSHGLLHGVETEETSLYLIKNLTQTELKNFLAEGELIDHKNPMASAIHATCLSALLHDCGRFNKNGETKRKDQKNHPYLGADRATQYCQINHLYEMIPYVKNAIENHEYKNQQMTPIYTPPPKTIIGKIVQSADQLDWFDIRSVKRTIEFGKKLDESFLDENISLNYRLNWIIGTNTDCVTVLLHQLFGTINEERFGIAAARELIEKRKPALKQEILNAAEKYSVRDKVSTLICKFE